ncbi:hypothetical protein B0H15DRAFT_866940 [Mycena belliarum]|uniref:TERF2-interacting telomeric protein 1 Myb domain-containing protein n=1 Tax=Mycena belliarum TaxID=1033014 RepID=A0AAD6TS60_9AGAR|nr:hypothetical protein B0H15DRAFT_866940 [Mycena belliae]
MLTGRTPFSRDDDTLLVKYLAKYNPGVKGRSGNKIYQLLVQDEHNRWRWSARHPWGGWRDRYTKNQSEFNERIKKYQEKKGLPTENSMYRTNTHDLRGSDAEEDGETATETTRKRKQSSSDEARKRARLDAEESSEGDELPGSSPAPRRHTRVPDIYPDITTLETAPPKARRPAPKLKTGHQESDFFDSVPPTPTTMTTTDAVSRPPTTASGGSVTSSTSNEPTSVPAPKPKSRALPKIIDGAFGTAFAGVRRWTGGGTRSDDDEAGGKSWPPKRSRKPQSKSAASGGASASKDKEKETRLSAPVPVRRAPQQVNAIASSSRVQLPSSSRRPRSPSREPVGLLPGEKFQNQQTPSPRIERIERPEPDQSPAGRGQRPLQRDETPPPHQNPSSREPSPLDWGSSPAKSTPEPVPVVPSPSTPHLDAAEDGVRRGLSANFDNRPPQSRRRDHILGTGPSPVTAQHTFKERRSDGNSVRANGGSRNILSEGRSLDNIQSSASRLNPQLSLAEFRSDGPTGRNGGSPDAHHGRSNPRSRSGDNVFGTGVSRLNPQLSLTDARSHGAPPANARGGGRPARRSRAPSPRTHERYRLPSPHHAGPPRAQSGTPLATKAKRRAPDAMPLNFRPLPAEDARRHSVPASAGLPQIDFTTMRVTGPRQSLPPRLAPDRAPLPRRHGSLSAPRTPATPVSLTTSTSVSPARAPAAPGALFALSASDRAFAEQLGMQQALGAMAANHHFHVEIVRSVYAASGDLAQTDAVLLRMREKAEAEGLAALRELGVDVEMAPLAPRHRRQPSAATSAATSAASASGGSTAKSKPSPSSAQRRKRHSHGDTTFRPQPLEVDVLAETDYSPPSSSRAGALARLAKKGRKEEGLQREARRASGGGTLSGFERGARMHALRPDMEDDLPHTPPAPFAAFAEGNVEVLRELEKRDVVLGMRRVVDVARYMMDGAVPSPYR